MYLTKWKSFFTIRVLFESLNHILNIRLKKWISKNTLDAYNKSNQKATTSTCLIASVIANENYNDFFSKNTSKF